jgi:hypothetical protein
MKSLPRTREERQGFESLQLIVYVQFVNSRISVLSKRFVAIELIKKDANIRTHVRENCSIETFIYNKID